MLWRSRMRREGSHNARNDAQGAIPCMVMVSTNVLIGALPVTTAESEVFMRTRDA